MNIKFTIMIVMAVVLVLVGCALQEAPNGDQPPQENPVPVLTYISPMSKVAHLPSFVLTLTGNDFVDGAVIVFNGVEMETTFIDSSEVACVITPEDTALQGMTAEANDPSAMGEIQNANIDVSVRNPEPGGGESNPLIFTVRSNHQFADAVNVSEDFPDIESMNLLVEPGGGVNVVFSDILDYTPLRIYMRRSSDGGDQWGALLPVTVNPATKPYYPVLAMSGDGDLYCIHSRGNYGYVYFSRSTDGGASWTTPIPIATNFYPLTPTNTITDMKVDSNGVIYVLVEFGELEERLGTIYFTKSLDRGVTWSHLQQLSARSFGNMPALAVDSNDNIFAVWLDRKFYTSKTPWYVHMRRSSNGGEQWTAGKNINEGYEGYYSGGPAIAANPTDDHLYVVWASRPNYTSGNFQIFFSRSIDNGASWTLPMNISANQFLNLLPQVAVDAAGNINVVWGHSGQIWFRRSTNDGTSWSQIVPVTSIPVGKYWSRIGVDDAGNVKIAWRGNTIGAFKVYLSRSEY